MKTDKLILLITVFLLFHYSVYAQQWYSAKQFSETSAIQFQWRDIKQNTGTKIHLFEWEFSNASDSNVTFNYTIVSNNGDQRIGRMMLKPQSRKLSGWLVEGDIIAGVEIRNVLFGETH